MPTNATIRSNAFKSLDMRRSTSLPRHHPGRRAVETRVGARATSLARPLRDRLKCRYDKGLSDRAAERVAESTSAGEQGATIDAREGHESSRARSCA